MKKVFIDCGFHHGEGLKHFIDHLEIDHSWYVYAFEPNPACDFYRRFCAITMAKEIRHTIPYAAAVWTENGCVGFRQENHFKSESGSPADGTSQVDGWASQVYDVHGTNPGLEQPITVMAMDFSLFIKHVHIVASAFGAVQIYCKMDIEGSEFPVLRKMLADGTIRFIKKIWIEFHEQSVPGESPETKHDLIKQLSQFTDVEKWH